MFSVFELILAIIDFNSKNIFFLREVEINNLGRKQLTSLKKEKGKDFILKFKVGAMFIHS